VLKAVFKYLVPIIFGIFGALQVIAQSQYGNEWIRPFQQYVKIPVAKDGIYRLTYNDLQAAGFAASDYTKIQLFHRGTEQAILINKVSGGSQLGAGDYIEFYGLKNTGVGDAELYKPASSQPHQYYNLYSDTASYFLTENTQGMAGKRMGQFSEVNVTNIPAETFHSDQKLKILASQYSTGREFISGYVQNTFFDVGEGWTGDLIVQNQSVDYLIDNIASVSVSSGSPQLEIQLVGRADLAHSVEIWVGPGSPSRLLTTLNFSGYNTSTYASPLNWTDISADGKLTMSVKGIGANGFERVSASFIKITFPQNFNMSGASEKLFQLSQNVNGKSYVQIQNAPTGVKLFDVTDSIAPVLIGTTVSTTLNAVISNTSISRKLLATKDFITPLIKKVSFRQITASAYNYIIISHPLLMKPAGGYSNPVKAYAVYRASPEGGAYDTLVMDIHQVYNQFNYGEISPLAITKFMAYMVDKGNPKYLFIIGRGLEVKYGYHRNAASSFNGFHDLVPTAGMPSSDMAFTAGLSSTQFEPAVPTGRISALTPQHVVDYLNKVKEMESASYDHLWRKEVLHLSGGLSIVEQGFFKNILNAIGQNVDDFYLGGKVSVIAKNTTDIEFINISDKVNSGVNLITLFGHSTSSTNDFNIGSPNAPELGYDNKGKYPILLLNGCNGGNFFDPEKRYGEDWILTPEKGSLGFMANASFGFTDVLSYYTDTFYKVAYRDSTFIHEGVGDIQKEVVKRMIGGLNEFSDTIRYATQAQQMFLLGDPAVKVFGASKPDYEINNNSVFEESLNGEPITAFSDSFAIKIVVRNFGRAKENSVTVRITQTLNDNSTVTYDSVFAPVLYSDTLTLKIFKNENGFGTNVFDIEIDADHTIDELNESNNTARLELMIPSNTTKNIFPQGFAIINTSSVNLTVQSTNVLDEERDDSPYMQQYTLNGKIAAQTVQLLNGFDTLAYYWNSKFKDAEANESEDSVVTSFTYINDDIEGWAQVHFPQFNSNEFIGLIADAGSREFKFKETITDVSIVTFGSNSLGYAQNAFGTTYNTGTSVKVGGTEYHPISLINSGTISPCRRNSISLLAFNKLTTAPYISIPVIYWPVDYRACGRRPEIIANFVASEVDNNYSNDLLLYIENIPAGDSVLLFTLGDPQFSSWSPEAIDKLTELGISSQQLSTIIVGEPAVIFAKKGTSPGSAIIQKSSGIPEIDQALLVEATITGRASSGTMTSSVIGPALHWQSLLTGIDITELPQTDEYSFDVFIIDLEGNESVWKTGITGIQEDLTTIDAEEYPYLKIVYHASDDINLTPPQLSKWLVTYTPAAEGVIVFDGSTNQQTLQEGETWSETFGFKNISQKVFSDSLSVQYYFYNYGPESRTTFAYGKKIKAPLPGEQTDFNLDASTIGKAGMNNVKVVVNPKILPELYYDNNSIELKKYLNVFTDQYSPILDVTVDGRHLVNGDYVSSNPTIALSVWDENPLMLLTDTTSVELFLKSPCDACVTKRIYFTRPDVTWFPATSTSDFLMEFKPQNLEAGIYELTARAFDASGNINDTEDYVVSFVVASDNSIIIQKPYPNPSSSTFFFNVVIAGDVHPDVIRLQIMSSNGMMLGEFIKTDFNTGSNIIPWSGTDASGAPLSNGLYFYRVVLSRDGNEIKTSSGKLMLRRE